MFHELSGTCVVLLLRHRYQSSQVQHMRILGGRVSIFTIIRLHKQVAWGHAVCARLHSTARTKIPQQAQLVATIPSNVGRTGSAVTSLARAVAARLDRCAESTPGTCFEPRAG